MPEDALCQYLPWDSDFFGYRIARAKGERWTEEELRSIGDWCEEQKIDCLYFLADPEDAPGLRRLEEHGLQLVDTRVTLKRTGSVGPDPIALEPGSIRDFSDSDLESLKDIARRNHRNTRFWNDGHFSPRLCEALYERWIENSCHGQAKRVLVAQLDARPVGYITCVRESPSRGRIGLFAVDNSARGHGLGAGLIQEAISWFRTAGINEILVTTQGSNEAAQRAYQKQGFFVDSVRVWFHYWPRSKESRCPG